MNDTSTSSAYIAVIAAIEGYAVAGGIELALWCDLRVAATDATLGVFCRRWGVPLVDGGTIRLPRLIGTSHANDLILTGRGVGDTVNIIGAGPASAFVVEEIFVVKRVPDRRDLLDAGGVVRLATGRPRPRAGRLVDTTVAAILGRRRAIPIGTARHAVLSVALVTFPGCVVETGEPRIGAVVGVTTVARLVGARTVGFF